MDFAQDEVPPYKGFGLLYTAFQGVPVKPNEWLYGVPIYVLEAYANIAKWKDKK